ncbi:hypothetical protein HPB50_028671 [Hyalomma asiaticum]|nr:hypothetical protein HPB50_028671 [Hyalomma asiaticum]
MFALVRFLNGFDAKEYALHVENIQDFYPADEDDFVKNKVYKAHWIDKDPNITGLYPCQILLLAGSKEELFEKRGSKRVPRTVINPSDVEVEEENIDFQLPAAHSRQTLKQANKKNKHLQAASKSAAYQDILKEHVSSAFEKNKATRVDQAVKNKEKMKRARQEEWQRREPYDEVIRERNELRQIVATMTEKMDAKLSAIMEMLQLQSLQPRRPQEHHTGTASELEGREVDEGPSRDVDAHRLHREPSSTPPAPIDKEITASENRQPVSEAVHEADPKEAYHPFTDIGDGKYHVKDGVIIGVTQADKILAHKKPSLVAKDMAQAIWGREGLAERSYGGKLAPKDYKNPTAVLRKQLSPQKVAVVIDTVNHWGDMKGVSVKETIENMPTILSQKIQDIRRQKKKGKLHAKESSNSSQ